MGEVRRERFQRKNAARAMRATPATTPTTMPAIAPPEREELSSSESESEFVGVDDGAVVDSVVEGSADDVEAVVEVMAVVVDWARSSSSTGRLVAQGVLSYRAEKVSLTKSMSREARGLSAVAQQMFIWPIQRLTLISS